MRARMSIVLAGFGKFVLMTSAFCVAMTIAITGPPTPSETAGVSAIVNHAVRRFDSAALNLSFDLCRSAAMIAHAAGLCPADGPTAARNDTPAGRNQVAAVSQTLPESAREILPPDTFDQIRQPPRHEDLLGAGPATPRHAAPPVRRAHAAARAHANPARGRRAANVGSRNRNAGSAAVRARRAPPRHAARTPTRVHAAAPPARPTPITAPRRTPPRAAPALVVAPPPPPAAATPAVESPALHEDPPLTPTPEEHANAPETQSEGSNKGAEDAAPWDEELPPDDAKA